MFQADREPQEILRRARRGPFHRGAVLMRLWAPPRLVARMNKRQAAAAAMAFSRVPRTWNDSMPPNAAIWRAAMEWPGCSGRPG